MLLYFLTLCWLFCKTESLICLSCTNVSLPSNCTSITPCNARQKCYTTAVGIGKDTVYNLGCLEEQKCLGQSSSSIVGRSVGEQCSQCCAVDRCNEKLCSGGTQGGPVAFTITHPNSTVHNGPLFTKVETNVGGGYDPSTGVFTCPVAGRYEFTFYITASGTIVYCCIYKNGDNIAYDPTGYTTVHNMASSSVFIQLSVGDDVSLHDCGNFHSHHPKSFQASIVRVSLIN